MLNITLLYCIYSHSIFTIRFIIVKISSCNVKYLIHYVTQDY